MRLSQPQIHYWIHRLLPGVPPRFAGSGRGPERDAQRVETSALALAGAPNLAVDGRTAPPTPTRCCHAKGPLQRQEKDAYRQEHPPDQRTHGSVVYLGPTLPGKTHDKKAVDEASVAYRTNTTLDKDTGLQGYEPAGVLTTQPKNAWVQRLRAHG